MQQLAAEYLASVNGIGADEKVMFGILEKVGKEKKQDAFNRALKHIDPNSPDAISLAEKEFGGNRLKRLLFKAKLERSRQLYTEGKESKTNLSDWHYRLEGILGIPLGLFDAFKKHFFTCAGTLAGIALFASFVPYLAAQLSNVITLMSAGIVLKSELAARKHPKGSVERQEKLKESGEGLAGVTINFIPLPAVVEHLQHGRQAIKQVVKGEKTIAQIGKGMAHAADEVEEAAGLLGTVKAIPGMLAESAKSTPVFIKENLATLTDAGRSTLTAVTKPGKFLKNDLPKGVQAGLAYDSSLPQTLQNLKGAKNPAQFAKTAGKALTDQAVLAMTLIDEILFPMVKILQTTTGGGAKVAAADTGRDTAKVPVTA